MLKQVEDVNEKSFVHVFHIRARTNNNEYHQDCIARLIYVEKEKELRRRRYKMLKAMRKKRFDSVMLHKSRFDEDIYFPKALVIKYKTS